MMRVAVGFALLLLALPGVAQPKIYKCKNEKGELYYSHAFDPARCAGGGAQLNDQGLSVKEIERRKSAEELAAEKAAAEKKAEEQRVADVAKQADQVLMLSYASEEDLVRAHQQETEVFDNAIATTHLQVQSQEKSLAQLLGSAAEAERAGRPVPDETAKGIATVRLQIEEQNSFIERQEVEKEKSNAEFAVKLKRYRELKAQQASH
jgi:hypothetical protein